MLLASMQVARRATHLRRQHFAAARPGAFDEDFDRVALLDEETQVLAVEIEDVSLTGFDDRRRTTRHALGDRRVERIVAVVPLAPDVDGSATPEQTADDRQIEILARLRKRNGSASSGADRGRKRDQTHDDMRQRDADPPAEPAQEQVVNVRLVTRQEDERLLLRRGGDGDLAELLAWRFSLVSALLETKVLATRLGTDIGNFLDAAVDAEIVQPGKKGLERETIRPAEQRHV